MRVDTWQRNFPSQAAQAARVSVALATKARSGMSIGIYTQFPKRKLFQGKALTSNSAQMNRVSHDNIIIFSDGYDAVFSGFFFG